jgi:hypothetical protein
MGQWSGVINVDGSGAVQNFGTLLTTAGACGLGLNTFGLTYYRINNPSGSVTLRVIQTNDGVNAPSSPSTKGIPVLNTKIEASSGTVNPIMDAGTTWLYTASSIPIEFEIISTGV